MKSKFTNKIINRTKDSAAPNRKFSFRKLFIGVPLIVLLMIISSYLSWSQTTTFPSGSFIINMGVTPQTIANGLKPYGMVYELVKNYGIPVSWVIEPTKIKDGIDFSYNGIDYRGGPFIIPAIYRDATINARIAYWVGQGVVGATTTSPITVPVAKTFTVATVPNWTLDKTNGALCVPYFVNAGIPPSAYGGSSSTNWKNPADLNDCDDVFSLPHADPKWATHSNLLAWNRDYKGNLYTSCHSGSATENMYNPANIAEQTNFLSLKSTQITSPVILPVLGSTNYAQNTLLLWGNHTNGTVPYSYTNDADPVMQFMGTVDAALQNGSEQIYIPLNATGSGWRPTTIVGVYDADHPQRASNNPEHRPAIIVYGHGFGDAARGYVMYEAGHKLNSATAPANIAAQRAFFNFAFWTAKNKSPEPGINVDLSAVFSGTTNNLSFVLNGPRNISEFTILWESSCGGSFSSTTTQTTIFTAPTVSTTTPCVITITLTDLCHREYKVATAFNILCSGFLITNNITNPCFGSSNGSIVMDITGASGPFNWTWTRTSPAGGPTSGTGTTISGLAPGTYNVTVTANGGTGCSKNFTATLTQSTDISITATPVPVSCNGGSNGSINTSVSGGNPGYTYAWTKTGTPGFSSTAQNPSGLQPGTYNVTVTDSKGCTKTASAVVTQPDAIVITPTPTNVSCFGTNNGSVNLSVTGGNPGYTYLWNDGNSTNPRTGMAPGTYSVIVTDSKGCTQTASGITITQPTADLALTETHVNVSCNAGATGSIDLSVTGGTSPYTYAWTRTGGGFTASTQDISTLTAGTYNVTVTDNKLCTKTLSVVVTQPAALNLSTSVTQPSCPPGAQQNSANGAITLTVTGGTGPFTYLWTASGTGVVPSGQSGNKDLTLLVAGTYSVLVTDNNGCTKTTSVTLTNLYPNPATPGSILH